MGEVTTQQEVVSSSGEPVGMGVIAEEVPRAGGAVKVLLVRMKTSAGLRDLPVVGSLVPEGADVRVSAVQFAVASQPLTADQAARINQLITDGLLSDGVPQLPMRGLPSRVCAGVEVEIGGSRTSLLSGHTPLQMPVRRGIDEGDVGVIAAPVGAGGAAPAPSVWVDVRRTVGPLRVDRVGVAYQGGLVWLMVDAAVEASGLSFGVLGLGLGCTIGAPVTVKPRLDGLSLEYSKPPVELVGALIKQETTEYNLLIAGMAAVGLKAFSFDVVGAYYECKDGSVSLFLFGAARLAKPVGPPPLQISGFSAGFGYNSRVRLPKRTEMAEFPFIAGLTGGTEKTPAQALRELTTGSTPWVRPARGQLWFALGIDVRSFEFIDGKLLAIAEFGDDDFMIALLGSAVASFPKTGKTYAQVELLLQAVYRYSERALKIDAAISPRSFLLDESCRLYGGAAFYLWFDGSDHPGDFVLTLGGYHPAYQRPAHYPDVPRVGFSWAYSSVLSIAGEAYFALTPSAVMAGGRLEVRFHDGGLRAWLTAYADLLIAWKPFRFDVAIGISIGVSYRLDLGLFGTTISVQLGASLHLWGPPTAGTVTVHLAVFDVTIEFGPRSKPPTLDWAGFKELMGSPTKLVTLTALSGLMPTTEPEMSSVDKHYPSTDPWLVSSAGFSFATQSAIPLTTITISNKDGGNLNIQKYINLRPMAVHDATCVQTVTITVKKDNQWRDLTKEQLTPWQVSAEKGQLPQALWGQPLDEDTRHQAMLETTKQLIEGTTGIRVDAPSPQLSDKVVRVESGVLDYEDFAGPCQLTF